MVFLYYIYYISLHLAIGKTGIAVNLIKPWLNINR